MGYRLYLSKLTYRLGFLSTKRNLFCRVSRSTPPPEPAPVGRVSSSAPLAFEDDAARWGNWAADGHIEETVCAQAQPTVAELCLRAGFPRALEPEDELKTKPRSRSSAAAFELREGTPQ